MEWSLPHHEGLVQHRDLVSLPKPNFYDIRNISSEFKYRVWYTWCMLKTSLMNFMVVGIHADETQETFWAAVSDPNDNLWLWKDEDEKYIKSLIDGGIFSSFSDSLVRLQMSEADYVHACRQCEVLKASQLQHRTVSPVSHLDPPTRLRFMAWLLLVAAHPLKHSTRLCISLLLATWARSIDSFSDFRLGVSPCCGVEDHLDVWLQTVLHVYSVDELRLMPWKSECSCFPR
jgi:hypothetical protein